MKHGKNVKVTFLDLENVENVFSNNAVINKRHLIALMLGLLNENVFNVVSSLDLAVYANVLRT